MTKFSDAFVDIKDFHPPSTWQARFSNLMVWLIAALLLTGGWFFLDWMMNQFGNLVLIEGEPSISYPAKWKPVPVADQLFVVVDPVSDHEPAASEQVAVLPAPPESFDLYWPEQRPTQFTDYREQSRLLTSIFDGRRALLMTYSFVPDKKTNDDSPRVVGQDLVFEIHEGEATHLVVVTLTATESDWKQHESAFQNIWRHMSVVLP